MRIRSATEADAAAAAAVNVTAWRAAFHGIFSEQFLDSLSVERRASAIAARFGRADYSMRVALDDGGAVVGFADWGPPREAVMHDYELYALYVLPSHQQRGLGRGLLQVVASAILAEGRTSLMCSVLEQNPHRAFYDRLGGRQIGRRSLLLDDAERAVIWYGWQRADLAGIGVI
ncbi:MAG: GNAT family N-acetyltransferase [Gemmatimonadota bacterium]